MTTLDELEKLAGAATPGPWRVSETVAVLGSDRHLTIISDHRWIAHILEDSNLSEEDAAFIAAANPETILLLCRVARAAGELEDSAADPKATPFSSADYRAAVERQRLALEALRTVLAELKGEV
jgi:hypothetical protein